MRRRPHSRRPAAWLPGGSRTREVPSGVAAGANGISSGPVSAPAQASAQAASFYPGSGTGSTGGQPCFAYSGNDDFPDYTTGLNPAQNYWVDLEVTPGAPASGPPDVGIPHPATTEPGVFTGSDPHADVGEPGFLGGVIGEPA